MEQDNNYQQPEQKRNNSGIYIAIIAALALLCGYLFFTKNQIKEENLKINNDVAELSTNISTMQADYDAAKVKLDELYGQNASMDSLLKTKDGELADMKNKIESILKDKNATASQLKEAQSMIAKLNTTVTGYQQQIVELKKENIQLSEDKKNEIEKNQALTEDKKVLETQKSSLETDKTNLTKKVELGSVLHASGFKLEAINQKRNLLGKEKEVETSKARKVDLMRITFDLDDNRISETGEKIIYIAIKKPDGTVVGNNTTKLSDGTDIKYTTSKIVPYKQGEKSYGVSNDWRPDNDFEAGSYTVDLYNNGFNIGKGVVTLK